MITLHPHLADPTALEHACRGLPINHLTPIVDAAAELGDLHTTRYATHYHRRHVDRHRLLLVRYIDTVVAQAVPPPRDGARSHPESVGMVVDQIALWCAVGYRAPRSLVSASEADDAQAHVRQLGADYADLIDEVAAGICRLPAAHQIASTAIGLIECRSR